MRRQVKWPLDKCRERELLREIVRDERSNKSVKKHVVFAELSKEGKYSICFSSNDVLF